MYRIKSAIFVGILMAVTMHGSKIINTAYAAPETTLQLTPRDQSITSGASFNSDIYVSTGANQIVSADIVISFNPQLLFAESVVLTDFLPEARAIQRIIDNQNGKITFSFYTTKENAKSGQGALATIKWNAKNSGINSVSFDSKQTLIYALNEGNALKSTVGATYRVTGVGGQTSSTTNTTSTSNNNTSYTNGTFDEDNDEYYYDAGQSTDETFQTGNSSSSTTESQSSPQKQGTENIPQEDVDGILLNPSNLITNVLDKAFNRSNEKPQLSVQSDSPAKQTVIASKNEKPSNVLLVVFIIIGILCAFGGVGFYIWDKRHTVLEQNPQETPTNSAV